MSTSLFFITTPLENQSKIYKPLAFILYKWKKKIQLDIVNVAVWVSIEINKYYFLLESKKPW